MHIEVRRPFSLLIVLGLIFAGLASVTDRTAGDVLRGQGGNEPPQLAMYTAEDEMKRTRLESQIAQRHIEILTYQLRRLEQEREVMQGDLTEAQNEEFRRALRELLDLIEGKRRADEKMVQYFGQIWDARRSALASATLLGSAADIRVQWPVKPEYGISAVFDDKEYEEFFGMKHEAIDIPALQGTPIAAAAPGIVEEVVDNGLGFNYVTIRHEGAGFVTLYGHLTAMHVSPGQHIEAGESVGLSGGMPGTPGACMSTGPHLHFQILTAGGPINPLPHLPASGARLRK